MESQVIQVELPVHLIDALEAIANHHNDKSLADALARAIATQKFLDEQDQRGGRVLIDRNGALEAVRMT